MKTIPSIAWIALTALSFSGSASGSGSLKDSVLATEVSFPLMAEQIKGDRAVYVPPVRGPSKVSAVGLLEVYSPIPVGRAVQPGVATPKEPLPIEKPKQPEFVIDEPPAPPAPPAPEAPVEVVETPEPSSAPPALTKAEKRQQAKDCIAALPKLDLSGLKTKKERNQAARAFAKNRFDSVNGCLVAAGLPAREPKKKDSGAGSSMSADAETGGGSSSSSDGSTSGSAS